MRDDFASKLQDGSAAFVAVLSPPGPEAARRRGDKRRRRKAITSAVLALAIGAGGGGVAFTSFDQPGPASGTGATSAPASAAPGRPGIVAVTAKGALVVLNPVTGEATKVLVGSGVAGGALAVSPGGSTVYFAVRLGCRDEIESVPVAGGRPTEITSGVLPSVSPDGTKLAFTREPFSGGSSHPAFLPGCAQATPTSSDFTVVVRDLASGHETVYPAPPGGDSALPVAISRLSWAPSGQQLLVSAGPVQDNEGWDLVVMDLAAARYYLPSVTSAGTSSVPVTSGPSAARSYYREGVFAPDGELFVNVVCCSGVPVRQTSSLLQEVGPAGQLVRQVAIGYAGRDHTSLDADPAGGWLLYLSGSDLFLAQAGTAAFTLTSGLIAAAWR
jgi:WD40-like Beta Propeller Repeat